MKPIPNFRLDKYSSALILMYVYCTLVCNFLRLLLCTSYTEIKQMYAISFVHCPIPNFYLEAQRVQYCMNHNYQITNQHHKSSMIKTKGSLFNIITTKKAFIMI